MFLRSHMYLDSTVLINNFNVNKLIMSVVLIVKCAKNFIAFFIICNGKVQVRISNNKPKNKRFTIYSFSRDRYEKSASFRTFVGSLEISFFVHLTFDAVLELLTAIWTRRTFLAIFSRISHVVFDFAFTPAALIFSVSRTNLTIWCFTVFYRVAAFTSLSTPRDIETSTRSAFANTLVGPRAQYTFVTVAGKVIAFAKRSTDYFFRIFTSVAATLIASANSTSAAFDIGFVVLFAFEVGN